jgi:hypothetical protein
MHGLGLGCDLPRDLEQNRSVRLFNEAPTQHEMVLYQKEVLQAPLATFMRISWLRCLISSLNPAQV